MASGSIRIVRGTWAVLRQDLELMWIPVITFVAFLLAMASWVGLGVAWGGEALGWGFLPLAFVLHFFTIFGNAAVVAAATARMEGEDPTLNDAFRMAWSARARIARWTVYSMTAGALIRMSGEGLAGLFGWVGRLFGTAAEIAWSVITFFVVPVILFEKVHTSGGAVARARVLARTRWADQLTGRIRIAGVTWLVAGLMALLGLVVALTELPNSFKAASIIWIVGVPIPIVLGATMSGVFGAALYRYSVSGAIPEAFRPLVASAASKS